MPITLVTEHDGARGTLRAEHGHGLGPYLRLKRLTVAVELAQLGSQAHGLGVRAGEQQLRGKAGTAQTSGDVQPRGKREAHV